MPKKKTSRNAQGGGTIRQRKDGRWEARFTVGRDPGTGKQIQRSIYGDTQKEVRQQLQKTLVALEEGTYQEPSKMLVGDWLDVWVSDYCLDLKKTSVALYKCHIKNHLKPYIGHTRLSALTPHMIQGLYNRLYQGKDDTPKLSPKTIKNVHGVLHKALSQAVQVGYLRQNPCDHCNPPRVEKPEIKPLDDSAIAAFLEAIQGHPLEKLYIVDLFTGMRESEILGLTWDCIDFENSTIRIYRQLQIVDRIYQFGTLKNDKPRAIVPAPTVMKVLREQRREQLEMQMYAGAEWSNEEGFVFTNEHGKHLARQTVYKNFKSIVASIGMPSARFHDLRHSYAVASLQAGDDIKTVQENLGHHTPAFTLDVYGHVTDTMRRRSAARMESFIQSVQTSK
ncbi:MAG: site-specific integrase [Clostridiales bacterium]|nr:site-specific integrase [Clostridiales bacterium]MDY4007782.1 site-specific integrase [Candidatus Limiplasma sp.]